MGSMDSSIDIQEVRAYLNGNAALKAALGVDAAVELEPHFLGEGEHNLNYWFAPAGDACKYVLRVNVVPQPFHENQVAYEFGALKALESSGVTPRALYLDDSSSAPGKGVLVESFCEGDELDFDTLKLGDLEQVARIMANIHTVQVAHDCPLFKSANPMQALLDECIERFEGYKASGFAEDRLVRWSERFLETACDQVQSARQTGEARIVNTEPLASHFLILHDEVSGKATGGSFIDWERPVIGDPAQDVAYFIAPTTTFWDSSYLMPADKAAEFVETYWAAIDGRLSRDGFDERLAAWHALTLLRSVTWCCRAQANQLWDSQTHLTDKTRQKLAVYLSDEFMNDLVNR